MQVANIAEDFQRFAHSHSWYKHCPPNGSKYTMKLCKGQQGDIDDSSTPYGVWHWHFHPVISNDDQTVLLINSFTRGLEPTHRKNNRNVCGFNIINMKWPEECRLYLQLHYPDIVGEVYREQNSGREMNNMPCTCAVFECEYNKQLQMAITIADKLKKK